MRNQLSGQKIAVLVANGFNETDMTQAQRALLDSGADIRIVSMDQGLVNSWKDGAWGLHFASDQVLSSALAADYDILIIPGGEKSMDKLKLTGHTRRFVGGFMNIGKPVVAFDEANDLLAFLECPEGCMMSMSGEYDMDDMVGFLMNFEQMCEAA